MSAPRPIVRASTAPTGARRSASQAAAAGAAHSLHGADVSIARALEALGAMANHRRIAPKIADLKALREAVRAERNALDDIAGGRP